MISPRLKSPSDTSRLNESIRLIGSLQNPLLFDHSVNQFSVIETHISWVILTGKYAYKIKKPVNFDFVDFSTLEKRYFYCTEELRLNQRFAPDLYLDIVAIKGSHKRPSLGNDGKIIEYAVKMREFSQQDLLNNIACKHKLEASHIESLVNLVSDFHRVAQSAEADSLYGSADTITEWTREGFEKIENETDNDALPEYYLDLKNWCLSSCNKHRLDMTTRRVEGFVRECHGDLHLGNIACIDGQITLFDCIEFNPALRWIDTTSEIAFLAMDLYAHGYFEYAWKFINHYFEASGDHAGVALLRHYIVYRAMVRAKVEALRMKQEVPATNQVSHPDLAMYHYLNVARYWASNHCPAIIIMHGLSGSGKSSLARRLVGNPGAIQIRSDVERKRLFKLDTEQSSGSKLRQGIYTQDATQRTYDHLEDLARIIMLAGFCVIVDACFLKSKHRNQFKRLAQKHEVPFIIISCNTSIGVLRDRITTRTETQNDPSEANSAVLQYQINTQEAITIEERESATTITSTRSVLNPGQMHRLIHAINVPEIS